MEKEVKRRIRQTLSHVVDALVRRDYAKLEAIIAGIRLKAEHIEAGVNEYGKTLSFPSDDVFDEIDVIQIVGRSPSEYSIRFPLFTEEEGQSDLELQATLIDDDAACGIMRVEIDGILVP